MKHILFFLLFLLLVGPALQAKYHWVEEPTLAGAYHVSEHPSLSVEALTSGTYQAQLENYLEDRIGFRTWLIQLRNQLSFSFLGVARSTDLVIGNNVLFQQGPVDAYLGKDFMGEAEIQRRVRRMRIVQDDLAKRGIPFLFMMAPNKGRYQPEDLPYWTLKQKQPLSNYEVFVREMKANQVNLLDFCQLFARWKDTTAYALFPSGGTHWSAYGSTLAADTLFKRIEKLGSFDLIDFRRTGPMEVSQNEVRGTDGDLSGPLNLLFGYKHYPMAYPHIVFDPLRPPQQQPNMLVSGDSFGAALMQFNPYFQTLFSPIPATGAWKEPFSGLPPSRPKRARSWTSWISARRLSPGSSSWFSLRSTTCPTRNSSTSSTTSTIPSPTPTGPASTRSKPS
ncbi:alginate O-acetyltransferase AlgX-related protein [Hymenobacter cellulosilyticus]|uniref:AlgX/AlgJ SGNH hydrolase-like domain-containing protein n=1 Tax=Hymenobacter cellulosilyticus TaxID=2932248 RepID=A0A8T9Q8R4_9BACT|nr:hypothetical protein [Hymenobacter cellulosilyticus]UOQ73525.1 hypothetical protein MUN79_06205 [Hymenobacter cellulosilyticus]